MSKQQQTKARKASASTKASAIDNSKVHEMVAREAYLRAEERGFMGGDPLQDWLEAEKKVTEKLKMNA